MEFYAVKSFDSYILATIWQGRFLNEGIECYLKDEFTVTLDPILTNAIGGIKLCVREDFLQAANTLISVMESEQKVLQTCKKCQSTNVQYIVTSKSAENWFLAIVGWALASFALKGKEVYHCYDCGFEFDEIEVTFEN